MSKQRSLALKFDTEFSASELGRCLTILNRWTLDRTVELKKNQNDH